MSEHRPDAILRADPRDVAAVRACLAEHGARLTVDEYARVCELLGRRPSVVELHVFDTMWSEHCSYKSSRPVLREYLPTEAPHVVLGPGEDAGIVRFARIDGRSVCLVLAHESHNHPSQVLPVEGAATGIGGIVRDVYCMGADVVGVLDPLRFGDPDGPNARRVRDIAWGVVDGIAQYGNALGVPNLGGETVFDATYDDNCLVNVVALGVVDEDGIVRSRVPDAARDEPFDVILVGKPTDASGFGGAAFASERLSEEDAVERQGAVQVPDPFLKRVLAEAGRALLAWVRAEGIPIGFKDLGAGGISCAVSEMAQAAGLGADVDLDRVPVAFDDLPPEVIACSETQERFALAVPARVSERVLAIYNEDFELPHLYTGAGAAVIGRVTREPRFVVRHRGAVVVDAHVDAITTGIVYERAAEARPRVMPTRRELAARREGTGAAVDPVADPAPSDDGPAATPEAVRVRLLEMLGSINVCSRAPLYEHYDTMVQGRAVIEPGRADAAVQVLVPGHRVGLAVGLGSCARLGAADPYAGGRWAVIEAVRNVACVGALPVAVTDCLNFGDPEDPAVFHEFRESVRGLGDACRGLRVVEGDDHGVPVVSGNVSFYNQSATGDPIAPTPVVCCAGRLDDVARARSMALAEPGASIVLLGALHDRLAGSEYERRYRARGGRDVPEADLDAETARVRLLVDAFARGHVSAAHDVADGGLLVALAEMVLAGARARSGADVDLRGALREAGATREGDGDLGAWLFSEYGGVLVEVPAPRADAFLDAARARAVECVVLGTTRAVAGLRVSLPGGAFEVDADALEAARRGALEEVLYR